MDQRIIDPTVGSGKSCFAGRFNKEELADSCHNVVLRTYPAYEQLLRKMLNDLPLDELPLHITGMPDWVSKIIAQRLKKGK